MSSPTQTQGAEFEQIARRYLEQQGCGFIAANVRCRQGEIDLVMRHGRDLVFVEVRYRRNSQFGGAAASVTPAKRRRLLAAASWYLTRYGQPAELPGCRFDVVAISGHQAPWQLEWLPAAFDAS